MKKKIKLQSCLTPKQEIGVNMMLECVQEETGLEISVERLVSDAVRCLMYRFAQYGPVWYAGFNYGSNKHYIAEMEE
jgi:hypothetical protein